MSPHPQDPARHSPDGRAVVQFLADQDARLRAWDRLLDQRQRRIDDLLSRERAAVEPVEDPPVISEPVVEPVSPGAIDLDQLAASVAIGSPAHRQLREQLGIGHNENPYAL
jgi:hypothetical protein